MHAEALAGAVPLNVVTLAAADALGGVPGDPQTQTRDQLREEIRRTVRDAVQGAQQGANDAGRAATDVQRLTSELDRARDAVQGLQGGGGNVSVTREGNNIVIRTADGKTITLDQSIVPPPAIEGLVASLAPPPPPPTPFPGRGDGGPPESVVMLVSIILACVTIMVVGWAWARAFARRSEAKFARGGGGGVGPDASLRLERIEQAVDAMAVEMERVSEAQRYAARLLTERLPESQLVAASAARPTPDRA